MADGFSQRTDFTAMAPLVLGVGVSLLHAVSTTHIRASLAYRQTREQQERRTLDMIQIGLVIELDLPPEGAIAHCLPLVERYLEHMDHMKIPAFVTYERMLPFDVLHARCAPKMKGLAVAAPEVCATIARLQVQSEEGDTEHKGFPRAAAYLRGAWRLGTDLR